MGVFMKEQIIVRSMIDEKVFWDFSNFNTFKMSWRNWAVAVGFPVFMITIGIINIAIRGKADIDSGIILGLAFIAIGVIYPISYYLYYKKTIQEQIKKYHLSTPQNFYTCTLSKSGMAVTNSSGDASFTYDKIWRAYVVNKYVYLFVTQKRGFILPFANIDDASEDDLILCLQQNLGKRFRDNRK